MPPVTSLSRVSTASMQTAEVARQEVAFFPLRPLSRSSRSVEPLTPPETLGVLFSSKDDLFYPHPYPPFSRGRAAKRKLQGLRIFLHERHIRGFRPTFAVYLITFPLVLSAPLSGETLAGILLEESDASVFIADEDGDHTCEFLLNVLATDWEPSTSALCFV